jgi:hypothetical protein
MQKRRVMLDGAIAGAELNGDVEITGTEAHYLRRILLSKGGESDTQGLHLIVRGKDGGQLMISLRTHYHNKNKFFLNITGNPLTFLRGSNTFGYAEADRVMITAYRKALEVLGPKVPRRIMEAVANRDLNVHSLEFACYTRELKNKKQLLNDWAQVYRSAYYSEDGLIHVGLCDMLNIRFVRQHRSHSSINLRILTGDGREEEAMLGCYDKAQEIRDRQGDLAVVPQDIENRLRLDLNLSQGWFRKRQVNGRRLKTLKDICDYIQKKHKGSWTTFLAHEFKSAIDRTALFYMWSFDHRAVMRGQETHLEPEIMNALIWARASLRLTQQELNKLMTTNTLPRGLNLDPHPESLGLDMEILSK